jgi:hypothetical protein
MLSLPVIDGSQRLSRFLPFFCRKKTSYLYSASRLKMTFALTPKHDYLVGIDSDGCAFDTMELKHKECFIPNIINYFELQGVSKYARETA